MCLHPSYLCPRTCQLDPGICLEKRNGEIAEQHFDCEFKLRRLITDNPILVQKLRRENQDSVKRKRDARKRENRAAKKAKASRNDEFGPPPPDSPED
jgi:hypothetical protein